MKRGYNLNGIWSLLPTFRAVAEVEHLSRAAEELNVTPAAVSRAVSTLEARLATKLFERVPKGMRLTSEGQRLLEGTRNAMRGVDDAIVSICATHRDADLIRVAFDSRAMGRLLAYLLPGLLKRLPRVAFEYVTTHQVVGLLVAGDIDIALTSAPSEHPHVTNKHVASLACRWFTFAQDLTLPPLGAPSYELPPAVAIPSRFELETSAIVLPAFAPILKGMRSCHAGSIEVWRVSRPGSSSVVRRFVQAMAELTPQVKQPVDRRSTPD